MWQKVNENEYKGKKKRWRSINPHISQGGRIGLPVVDTLSSKAIREENTNHCNIDIIYYCE